MLQKGYSHLIRLKYRFHSLGYPEISIVADKVKDWLIVSSCEIET